VDRRDDLTVEVVFFGEGDKSGNVVVNEEATSKLDHNGSSQKEKQGDLKAKL
jgi:hypothetical protein